MASCVGWIADNVVPAVDWDLADDQGGAASATLFQDLHEIMALLRVQRLKPPVVQDQQFHVAKAAHETRITPVNMRDGKIGEEFRRPGIERRSIVTTGLEADRAGQPAFSDAPWTSHDQGIRRVDPSALQQGRKERAIKTTRRLIIHVLRRCHVA